MNDETNDDAPKVPAFLDRASCEANHLRFVERGVAAESVWCLKHAERGVAYCLAHQGATQEEDPVADEETETAVLMFFSDRGYATHVKEESFPEYEESEISLFDFLYRWLPGMASDGLLAGTNWTGALVGLEVPAQDLCEELYAELSAELEARYKAEYERLANEEGVE